MTVDQIELGLKALGIELDSCTGACPVQISGQYGDRWLYFRARGDRWELAVDDNENLAIDLTFADDQSEAAAQGGFLRRGSYGEPQGFEAGYMSMETAIALIRETLKEYTL